MIRKISLAAVTAAMMMILAGPAHAGSYIIGGKVYYFSLNIEALIAKVTGKDLKDGTYIGAEVKITNADTACSNPQTHVINPGQGPAGTVSGTSPNINDGNLVKNDKVTGNVYQTTATIIDLVPAEQRLNPPAGICKETPGVAQWYPLFWQDKNCNKGAITNFGTTCYSDYAASDGYGGLTYVTGNFAGQPVTYNTSLADWTYIYLPTALKFKADLINSTTGVVSSIYGSCRFPLNPANGEPYSITNPPVGGWAAAPTYYECVAITADLY